MNIWYERLQIIRDSKKIETYADYVIASTRCEEISELQIMAASTPALEAEYRDIRYALDDLTPVRRSRFEAFDRELVKQREIVAETAIRCADIMKGLADR